MTSDDEKAPTESSLNRELIERPLVVGSHQLQSRLIVGTGRYDSMQQMRDSLHHSGSDCVTVAVRREKLYDREGKNILDFLDLNRYTLLPNTAGCYTAKDAVEPQSSDVRSSEPSVILSGLNLRC